MNLRKRSAVLALLTVVSACSALGAARAAAQSADGGLGQQAIADGLSVQRNGALIANGVLVYGNLDDCGGDTPPADGDVGSTFTFAAQYDLNMPVVEAWLGVGGLEDCSAAANRLSPSSGALPPVCTFLGSDTSNTRTPTITVKGSRLFSQTGWNTATDVGAPAPAPRCDAVSGGQPYTVYLVPLLMPTTRTTAGEPITSGARSTLTATFTPYTRRPEAPLHLAGESGDAELGVSFALPPSSMTLTRYRAYFDVTDSGADGGASTRAVPCGSGLLDHHGLPPAVSAALRVSADSARSPLVLTDASDLPTGTNVAVAVISIDPAGNQSYLSDPVCAQRVDDLIFVCDSGASCDPKKHDGCALGLGTRAGLGSLPLCVLAGLALLTRRRRR